MENPIFLKLLLTFESVLCPFDAFKMLLRNESVWNLNSNIPWNKSRKSITRVVPASPTKLRLLSSLKYNLYLHSYVNFNSSKRNWFVKTYFTSLCSCDSMEKVKMLQMIAKVAAMFCVLKEVRSGELKQNIKKYKIKIAI